MASSSTVAGLELARMIAALCVDFRAVDLLVLDVRGRSGITDFMVLATCTSERQMKSLAEEIRMTCKGIGVRPLSMEGVGNTWWALLDFNDVVVHLFLEEARRYYDLEILWGDAPKVDLG